MQQQAVSNSEFSVLLTSIENKGFIDNTTKEVVELSSDTLRVAHSLAIIVMGDEDLDVEVRLQYGEEKKVYSDIRVVCRFLVGNLRQVMTVDQNTQQVSFDESLVRIIVPVAFSTARGYFSAKLEGSPLAEFPFPVIRTDTLIKTCRTMINRQ